MKKRVFSRSILVFSLLFANVLVVNKYSDKKIVFADEFSGWKQEGNERYFYQKGKKFTGEFEGKYYYEGKFASGWFNNGTAWYYFKEGIKHTGKGKDANGEMYFVNGKYANGYVGDIYYYEGKVANWWFKDGSEWHFFQNGKRHTGYAKDGNGRRYFANGKYANGIYEGKLFKDGVESKGKVYANDIFYDENSKPANGWYDDGSAWYYFKNGKKHNGNAKDGNGEMYFVNGKYANGYVNNSFYKDGKVVTGWYDDGSAWYFFKDGNKFTGKAKDGNGEMQFINGKYANAYIGGTYYGYGKIANGWHDDGTAWYFFINGKKFTGNGVDGNGKRLFDNGKYANGIYEGKLYKDGVVSKGKVYAKGIFYDENSKPATGWYDDGSAWYYFKDGYKFTGKAKDGNGEMQFINGKYANAYIGGVYYGHGKIANGWHDDGSAWYYFKDGYKYNGIGIDGNGIRFFVNGKYANGKYNGNLFKDGLDSEGKTYVNNIYYDENKVPANGWHDDGSAWYFFRDGNKFTGKAKDGNGEMQFLNGKYANAYINGVYYGYGKIGNGWYDDGTAWYFFLNGKKVTGFATDGNGKRYFINGKYANGRYDNKLYKEGLESNGNTYISGQYYDGSKYPATGWYDDGSEWYYFRDGYKYTGYATDGNGNRYFISGKYANGWHGGTSYIDGVETELADSNWYVQNGIWRVKGPGRSCHVNGNFIVVSLSDQTLWLVRNGQIISKIGIVGGKPSTPTVTGNFSVQSRETSRILRGPGYASRVSYWMPFHGSYGIHDANWQPSSAFSNNRFYRWGGSHGCVNVSPGSMGYIFNNSFVGMRVIVY